MGGQRSLKMSLPCRIQRRVSAVDKQVGVRLVQAQPFSVMLHGGKILSMDGFLEAQIFSVGFEGPDSDKAFVNLLGFSQSDRS